MAKASWAFAFSAVLILLGATGCSTREASKDWLSGPYYTKALSIETARHYARRGLVVCQDGHCHPSVAMVAMVGHDEAGDPAAGQCSGSLVAPDIILTNSHCVDDAIKTGAVSCQNNLWVYFPKTQDYPAESIECDSIIGSSQLSHSEGLTGLQIDYALLKLKRAVKRPTLNLDVSGLPDDLPLTFVKVNPVRAQETIAGAMEEQTCRVSYSTPLLPTFNDPLRPIAAVGGCVGRHGNSGSPLIDASGSARAIFHAISRLPQFSTIGLATNLACVAQAPSHIGERHLDSQCSVLPYSQQSRREIELYNRTLGTQVADAILVDATPWISSNSDVFAWSVHEFGNNSAIHKKFSASIGGDLKDLETRYATLVPKCFKNPAAWLPLISPGITAKTTTFKIRPPIYGEGFHLDERYRLKTRVTKTTRNAEIQVEFSPENLAQTTRSRVKLTWTDASSPTAKPEVVLQGELSTCATTGAISAGN